MMKENKYDDDVFFKKYSQMDRSEKGLSGAGEWETLKKMLPSFKGKHILDLGCGYGWHCQYAMEHGAESAIGIDISNKMLEKAKEKNKFEHVQYICQPIEDINFPQNAFDCVISSLAFHYIVSFEDIVRSVKKCIKSGGEFIFSVEHPVFTAYGTQDWIYDKEGNIMCFPVDNYYIEGERKANFLGEEVIKYHKTLTTYLNTLLENGFMITGIEEPKPPKHMLDTIPGMKNELRRPMMLIVSAKSI